MGSMMQSMSHDAYRRDRSPEQWAEPPGSRPAGKPVVRPDVYEEQADQWAVLRHEVEGTAAQRWDNHGQQGWEARDTDGNTGRAQARNFFDDEIEGQHHVDIVVVGVGGGGMNAVNRMISTHVRGVRFVAMNTDAQVLALSPAPVRLCLGQRYTKGLGAGGNAAVGMRAANESADEIRAALGTADLVFIAAGMGGGTGTGAAPVVASIAKKLGALSVGIVTLPFTFEGSRRRRVALDGIAELTSQVDALITVPNDRLLSAVGRERNLSDAFKVADDVLRQGVQGIAEVINVPGMVNVDFADVRSVLREAGTALMSIGQGQGRNRAQIAAEQAVAGGFLNVTIRGAKRVLFNISGGEDMTLFEVNEVAERIGQAIDDTADITFGAVVDPALTDTIRVTLIAAGMEEMHTMRLPAVRLNSGAGTPPTPITPPVQHQPERERSYPGEATQTPTAPRMPAVGTGAGNAPKPIAPPNAQPYRPAGPPARPQRSLDDLRGIRSMGRRHYPHQGNGDDDDGIDIPPFLKR
jgi:cell division protein FtsZ